MPTPIDGYSAYEDLVFCGEKYRVTVSFGTTTITHEGKTCALGMLTPNDGVSWDSVYSHPGVTNPATAVVRDMLRWSRNERTRWEHKRKYGYYPGEAVT